MNFGFWTTFYAGGYFGFIEQKMDSGLLCGEIVSVLASELLEHEIIEEDSPSILYLNFLNKNIVKMYEKYCPLLTFLIYSEETHLPEEQKYALGAFCRAMEITPRLTEEWARNLKKENPKLEVIDGGMLEVEGEEDFVKIENPEDIKVWRPPFHAWEYAYGHKHLNICTNRLGHSYFTKNPVPFTKR